MAKNKREKLNKNDRARLKEIISVLRKYRIKDGFTPEKLRCIFEELGPTFVKAGQLLSMRPELIPLDYCRELGNLRADVSPMPDDELKEIISGETGNSFDAVFKKFDYKPIGSASIAQVHKAVLADGSPVAVKVQRRGIYETMDRDIRLLRRLDFLVKRSAVGNIIDLDMILDELWASAQLELDFLVEAFNLTEFYNKNRDIEYVSCPKVYKELSTRHLLVMEFCTGARVDDLETLKELGYDTEEISRKIVSNYIKQIIEDRFFQADPHPGNILISNGKIIWLDMGMMSRISEYDARCYKNILNSIITHDYEGLKDAILAMGVCQEKIDEDLLLEDVEKFVRRYEKYSLNEINLAVAMAEAIDLAARYKVKMPPGVTMVARGIGTIEGLLEIIAPDASIISILASNHANLMIDDIDLKKEALMLLRNLAGSGKDITVLPSGLSDVLEKTKRGRIRINVESAGTEKSAEKISASIKKLAAGIVAGFIILASAMIFNGRAEGSLGISIAGFAIGLALAAWTLFGKSRK